MQPHLRHRATGWLLHREQEERSGRLGGWRGRCKASHLRLDPAKALPGYPPSPADTGFMPCWKQIRWTQPSSELRRCPAATKPVPALLLLWQNRCLSQHQWCEDHFWWGTAGS